VPSSRIAEYVTDRFQRALGGSVEFVALVQNCIAEATPSTISRWSSEIQGSRNASQIMRSSKSAGFLIAHNGEAACLRQTDQGHPIFPAEAFLDSASPQGIPEEVALGWYKQIAIRIAQTGRADAVFKFANGNAMLVQYTYDKNSPSFIQFKHSFRKAGERLDESALQFMDPRISSFTTVANGGRNVKFALVAGPRAPASVTKDDIKSAAKQI
jgi:hypothetical protein